MKIGKCNYYFWCPQAPSVSDSQYCNISQKKVIMRFLNIESAFPD